MQISVQQCNCMNYVQQVILLKGGYGHDVSLRVVTFLPKLMEGHIQK